MTDIDPRQHPTHKGAAGNPDTVREALAWRRKRDVDLLQAHGGDANDVQEWAEEVAALTNTLLRKIERKHTTRGQP